MTNFLDKDGLTYYHGKVKDKLNNKVDKVSGKGLSTNDYTTTEKNKLSGIASGAEVNVQSDWNQTDTTKDDYIKNKPTIPTQVTESTVSGWGFTKNTGTYSKPSGGIPKTDLASAVQTSLGKADTALQSHQDISGKQDKLTAGSNITITGTTISATDTTYSVATQSANGLMSSGDKTKLDGIATGANKTTVDTALSTTSTNPVQNKVINTALGNKQDKITSTNKLAYSLISGTPTIPTVNNAQLKIQVNGSSVQTFTANQSSDVTANIGVPVTYKMGAQPTNAKAGDYWIDTSANGFDSSKVVSVKSDSTTDTYSCSFINNISNGMKIRAGNVSVTSNGSWTTGTINYSGFTNAPYIVAQAHYNEQISYYLLIATRTNTKATFNFYGGSSGQSITIDWIAIGN